MWFTKRNPENQLSAINAAKALAAQDQQEDTMRQLATLSSGEMLAREFGYSVIQISDKDVLSTPAFSIGFTKLARKHHIVNGFNCLDLYVFYSGLLDPIYLPPSANIREFSKDVLGEYTTRIRVVHGICKGVVVNAGLFESLAVFGLLPAEVTGVLHGISYGSVKEHDFKLTQ